MCITGAAKALPLRLQEGVGAPASCPLKHHLWEYCSTLQNSTPNANARPDQPSCSAVTAIAPAEQVSQL